MILCISNAPRCRHGLGPCFATAHITYQVGSDSLKTKGSELPPRNVPPRRLSIRRRVAKNCCICNHSDTGLIHYKLFKKL